MSPNGRGFLLDPEKQIGPTRYSHARVLQAGDHSTIYVSGIAAVNPIDGTYEGVQQNTDGSFTFNVREQTAAVLRRLDTIIRGASGGKADIYNTIDSTVYVLDMKTQYADMNEEWNKVWPERINAPARATVGVRELPDPRFAVEIKATAVFRA